MKLQNVIIARWEEIEEGKTMPLEAGVGEFVHLRNLN